MKNSRITALLCFGGIALFLVSPKQCAEGVLEGLRFSGTVLIPSLFPISVLAAILVKLEDPGKKGLLTRGFSAVFHLPGECFRIYLLGLLGGYPLGAQLTAELYANGAISKRDALRFSAFCNHPGPAFLISALGIGIFGDARFGAALWGIHFLSSIIVGYLFSLYHAYSPLESRRKSLAGNAGAALLPSSISSSAVSMLRLVGSVCFFRALLRCIEGVLPLELLPEPLLTVLCGMVELSGAVPRLLTLPTKTAFLFASFLSGFGGLCVHLQAASAFSAAGLSSGQYIRGKLLQGALSLLLAFSITGISENKAMHAISALFIPVFAIFFAFSAKKHWISSESVL